MHFAIYQLVVALREMAQQQGRTTLAKELEIAVEIASREFKPH